MTKPQSPKSSPDTQVDQHPAKEVGAATAQKQVNPASGVSEADYSAAPIRRPEHHESSLTLLIEQQTAKIPSHLFLALALGAMAASLALELNNKTRASRFVGMWPPSLLIMGLYNKLVKTVGVT